MFLLRSVHAAPALDTIVFGGSASESTHSLVSNQTEIIAGQLGQSARRCLPFDTVGVNGGDLTFTMAVDPVRRNYVTVKLWGGDDTNYDMGRLYLYVPLDGVTYQVGYRHEGDYMPLSVTAGKPPLPGRFFYSTTLLPLWMTKGKTTLTLRIQSTGKLYGLGSGGPPSGNYQYNMTVAGRGIYRAYTHTEPMLDVSGETQGTAPSTTTRPAVSESTTLATFASGLNGYVNGRLASPPAAFTTIAVEYLAKSYQTPEVTAGYNNAAVIDKVISVLDAFCTRYYEQPSVSLTDTKYAIADGFTVDYTIDGGNEVWGGRFGPLGWAIHLLKDQLAARLDESVDYGAGGTRVRRGAWGDMLAASRDSGRFNRNSRAITNQSLAADTNIYKANRGLLALGDSRAFTEEAAQRYLKESGGLLPWLGSDLAGGGSSLKYGSNYYQITPKGLTREWGYVGGYGEMAAQLATFYKMTGNTAFRDQAVRMMKARAPFRRPAMEVSGSSYYRTVERTGLIAWRGVRECDGDFSNDLTYGEPAGWSGGMHVAALSKDPTVVGYAKQMLADNQYLNSLTADSRYYSTLTVDSQGAFDVFSDYAAVKAEADGGARLPMTDGQPDFVFADEVEGVVAFKNGAERMWVAPFWQAKTGTGINGIARFHYSTATYDQYGVLETNPLFSAGGYAIRPNYIDKPESTTYTPPDNPANAYAGEKLPIGFTPADAQDGSPYRGRVDFYGFRFGRYLFGLNAHASRSFELKTPAAFTSATDLVSGSTKSGTVTVAPSSSVVLYLADATDAATVPNAPLLLTAAGSSTPAILLAWSDAPSATSYTVRRAETSGGPYTDLVEATGITSTSFTDLDVTAGTVYYYVVSASNANGASSDSMEATTSAGLPSPWQDADVGTVGLAGSASLVDHVFTLTGTGSNIAGSADSFHFTSLPITGDGTLIARLASRMIGGTVDDKVGLMVRESTAAGSKNFTLLLDALYKDAVRVTYRASTNGNTSGLQDGASVTIPQWLKVERSGSIFRGYVSPDANAWTLIGEMTITMNSTVQFGMFVCARESAVTDQSAFDSVSAPPLWGILPSTPSGLSATASSGAAGLTWLAANGATSYRVKRALVSGGPYALVATTAGLSYSDTSLTNGITYYYVVSAVNATGESESSNEIEVTPVPNPPDTPAGVAATAGNGFVSLSWTAAYGASSYTVKRSTSAAGPFLPIVSGLADPGYSDLSVTNGTAYYYVVTATGLGGESAPCPAVSATPSAVASVPVSVVAVPGNTQIALSWSPANGASTYTVSRATSSGGPFTSIATGLTSTSYSNTGLTNGTTYYYSVSSVNAAGQSAASSPVSAVPSAGILPAPWTNADIGSVGLSGGASLSGSTYSVVASGADISGTSDQFYFISQPAAGNCEIIVRVTALTNTNTLAKAGLMIRKSLDANSPYAFIAVTPTTTNGVIFQYRSSAGGTTTSGGTATGNGRNPPEWLRLVISGTTVTAYRSNTSSLPSNWTQLGSSVNIAALAGSFYVGLAVTSRTNAATTTATFTNFSVTLGTPSAPANLTATAGYNQATLAWSASSGATGYTIKRALASGGPYTAIATGVTATTYTDTGLASGTSYYYVVSASNAAGEGGNSSQVVASTAAVPTGLLVSAAGGKVSLNWNAFSGATAYLVRRSAAPGGPYSTIATGIAGTSYQDSSTVAGQSYFYVVSAVKSGVWQTFDSAEAYSTPGMPAPWLSLDIGTVAVTGSGKYDNGVVTVKATGSDIGSAADSFRFAALPLTGNGTIIARMTGQDVANTSAKAGLMMRESLGANSKFVFAMRQADSAARFASRSATGGGTTYGTDLAGTSLPRWYKLERAGDTFTASISTDGSVWTPYGSVTISMNSTLYVGFAAVSRNSANILTATFDNLVVTGWTPPPFSPSAFTAVSGNTKVTLSWAVASGASSYNLRRSLTSGGPYSLLAGGLSGTSYTDAGLANGTPYYYTISSVGAAGESSDSAELAAMPVTDIQAWRLLRFGTAASAGSAADNQDPDGDQRTNLMEYALGSEPLEADPAPPTTAALEGAYLTLAFQRIADPLLVYEVWASNDLVNWGAAPIWTSTGASNIASSVKVTDPIPAGPRFLRLRISH